MTYQSGLSPLLFALKYAHTLLKKSLKYKTLKKNPNKMGVLLSSVVAGRGREEADGHFQLFHFSLYLQHPEIAKINLKIFKIFVFPKAKWNIKMHIWNK